jgi:photosystem II stability/assembly factor-like uncharacterized protein
MKLSIISFCVIMLISLTSYSQWEKTNGPAGGEVGDIVKVSNYLFLNSGPGGIYRSDDQGDHWVVANNGLPESPHCYAIAATDDVLYVAIYSHGIYKSIDFGQSWSSTGNNIGSGTFYSLLANGSDVYAGDSDGGFYYSGNGGDSWTKKGNGIGQVQNILIAGGNLFIAATNSTIGAAIYKSSDNGDNLVNINAPVTSINFMSGYDNAIYITGGQPTKISRDYGETWTSSDIGTTGHYMLASIYAYEDKVIIPAGNSTVFISNNEGVDWETITSLPYEGVVSSVYNEDETIILGGREGIYKSSNNGVSWSEKNDGLNNVIINHLETTDGVLFAGTNIGIFSSKDDGVTWNKLNNGLEDDSEIGYIHGVNIEGIHTYLTDIVVATGKGIFKSSTNGLNWDLKMDLQGVDINAWFYALAGDKDKIFACQTGFEFYSTSNGETWTTKHHAAFDNIAVFDAVVKGDTIIVLASDNLVISKNFGSTWEIVRVSTDYFFPNDALFINDDLYVATSQGLYVCTYPGTTWKKITGLPNTEILSLLVRNDALYAGTTDGLYVSFDNGHHWFPLNGLTGAYMKPLTFNDTYCFTGTYGASVWRNSWAKFNVRPQITGLASPLEFSDDQAIVIDINNLLVTDPDSNFPEDFILTIKPGTNYTVVGNEITTVPNYSGELHVPLVVSDGHSESNEYTATLNVITGISESDTRIVCFPNPTNQKININALGNVKSYLITDVTGRKIMGDETLPGDVEIFSVDVSALPTGIYFLELHGRERQIHRFSKY